MDYVFTEKRKADITSLRGAQLRAKEKGDPVMAQAASDAIDAELDEVITFSKMFAE